MSSRRRPSRRRWSFQRRFTVAGLVLAAAVALTLRALLPTSWLVAVLTGVNVATIALYGWDKRSARSSGDSPRVPESTLHVFCFLGGSPSAFLGQRIFRHKTRKGRFQAVFWVLVAFHLGLVIWAVSR